MPSRLGEESEGEMAAALSFGEEAALLECSSGRLLTATHTNIELAVAEENGGVLVPFRYKRHLAVKGHVRT